MVQMVRIELTIAIQHLHISLFYNKHVSEATKGENVIVESLFFIVLGFPCNSILKSLSSLKCRNLSCRNINRSLGYRV